MIRFLFLLLTLLWSAPAIAGSSVPLPSPAPGKGLQCVAPTEIMRKQHPSLLDHQRDETVRAGIRTRQFSLKECIACHAVAGSDGTAVAYEDPKHFCRECHDYAAVRIDCFDCHNSKPDEPAPLAALPHKIRRWCIG